MVLHKRRTQRFFSYCSFILLRQVISSRGHSYNYVIFIRSCLEYMARCATPLIHVWCCTCITCIEHVYYTYIYYRSCNTHIFLYMQYMYNCIKDVVPYIKYMCRIYMCITCVKHVYCRWTRPQAIVLMIVSI